MRLVVLLLPLFLLAGPPVVRPALADDAELCAAAIRAAEASSRVPPGLLGAVALSESGRYDARRGRTAPWPWTVNSGGDGRYFATKAEAIAHVEGLQRSGRRNIDVGCMQINLMHHPGAFASLDEAFDPARNVAYGAGFLSRLRDSSPSWARAVERYHTAREEEGRAYREKVYDRWQEVRLGRAPELTGGREGVAPDVLRPRVSPPLQTAAARGFVRLLPAAGRIGEGRDAVPESMWGRIGPRSVAGLTSLRPAALPLRPATFPERRPSPAAPSRGAAGVSGRGVLELIPATGRADVLQPSPAPGARVVVPQSVRLPGSRLRLVSSRRVLIPVPP
ncbi:transglycosylase SLT domain-containing protein [Geminicoccaceae bacterium SYSU G07066]|uniref:Transglycosylase SLT domain-containing protein n=1 Tax=Benzoatithermus flavus TaxID=3108223 RepID=A0ABU8XN38_9PROT